MSAESKCVCQQCGGHIAFPSEMSGQKTACPHCQRETILIVPNVNPQVRAIYPATSPTPGEQPFPKVALPGNQQSSKSESRCNCQTCGGPLTFPSEMLGQKTMCPHCQCETTLTGPGGWNPNLRPFYAPPAHRMPASEQRPPSDSIPQSTLTACFILSLLIPIAGMACGVWLITKNETKAATGCFVAAVVSIIICVIIMSMASDM